MSIGGQALMPRLSENDVFYWPQELEKYDGIHVPLRRLHLKDGGIVVGEAIFEYRAEDRQVWYRAEINNESVEKEIKEGGWTVSVGTLPAKVGGQDKICHRDGSCVSAPVFEGPRELALVQNPGIPEATLEVLDESKKNIDIVMHCESKPHIITSNECKCKDKNINMTETPKIEQPKTEEAAPLPTKTEVLTCPPGWTLKGEVCEKDGEDDIPAKEAPAPEAKSETASGSEVKQVDINVNVTKNEEKTEDVKPTSNEALKTEMKDEILKEMGEQFQPKSKVATALKETVADWKTREAKYTPEFIKNGLESGKVTMHIEKEGYIEENTQQLLTEAVTTGGTVSQVKGTSGIIIIPGSLTFEPIRSLGQFEKLAVGDNTVKFWTMAPKAFGTAAGVIDGSIATLGAHVLTAVEFVTATRGMLEQVTKDQLRDFPPAFMEKLKEVMRMAAIEDEHTLIVQTLASTSNDFNNGTTVVTAGFPVHLRGDTGALCDSTVTEDAIAELLAISLQKARRYLSQRGHSPVNNRTVALISSRAYDGLIADPAITEYIQEGNPAISEQGLLSRYFGIEIMVSENLLTANNAQRNIVLVAGKAFVLASQQEMTIQMEEDVKGQYVNIVALHDIGVEELDHSAYCIISSKND